MSATNKLIWYGKHPRPGDIERLQRRGYEILFTPEDKAIQNSLLATTKIAVFSHENDVLLEKEYRHLPKMINHGVRVIFLANRGVQQEIEKYLSTNLRCDDETFPWAEKMIFMLNLVDTNFDNFIDVPDVPRWSGKKIAEGELDQKLTSDERLLMDRAFPTAQEIHVTKIPSGMSGSDVYMVFEDRLESSIAHWAQPRLVKIGPRKALATEVGNMKAVSPFVPFELRPNLDLYIEGFEKALFVADFVENSESLLEVARAGRAETAISNLFNRTLHRWRNRAWRQGDATEGSLAVAAERLGLTAPDKIHKDHLQTEKFERLNLDPHELWEFLKTVKFKHRVASIHGDLHGDNVRVRGDDAILIDFGSVMGKEGCWAPLCFDVAMLEVALVFTCSKKDNAEANDLFEDPKWEAEIRPYYQLNSISRTPERGTLPKPTSWIFGCLQRIRAFGIYDQNDSKEYAIALAIAMWRFCKWSTPADSQRQRGRRVVALSIGAEIIDQLRRGVASESK
jgi:hypothetical protein